MNAAPGTGGSAVTAGDAFALISSNIQRVVKGKPEAIRLATAALFAEGHVLLEDLPGLGKTTLARCLAASVGGQFTRIQFTPDLLPGDITGAQVFHRDTERFVFHRGPVFGNIVMADEINRGTPKTQSALLEVMAEGTVTVDGERHAVPRPFMVVATQNPIELEGTYRLPEAQLDRFLIRLDIGYPQRDAEIEVVMGDSQGFGPESLRPVIDVGQLAVIIGAVRAARVHPALAGYAVDLAAATRAHPRVRYGASPRGSVALIRAARAWAMTAGRNWVTPGDIRDVAHAVLDHRVVLWPEAQFAGITAHGVVAEVLTEHTDHARTLDAAVASSAW